MRQQEINLWRRKGQQRLVRRHRVILQIYDAQETIEQMPVSILGQSSQARGDRRMAAPPAREPPMPVLSARVAVQAHPDLDPDLVEQRQVLLIEADSVGLHTGLDRGLIADGGSHGGHETGDEVRPGEQWFTTMQHESDLTEGMAADVLADAGRRLLGDRPRHPSWPGPPGLIGHRIHVAVIAGQIASTVDLQHKFPERCWTPAMRYERTDIKRGRPLSRSLYGHSRIKPHSSQRSSDGFWFSRESRSPPLPWPLP